MRREPVHPTLGARSFFIRPTPGEKARAAHVLRRLGFGPSRKAMRHILRIGIDRYIYEQLNPEQIDDTPVERRFRPGPTRTDDGRQWVYRWYTRMVHSRRQLLEKMTLIWHEHFSVNVFK